MPAVFNIKFDTIRKSDGRGRFVVGTDADDTECRSVSGDHAEDAIQKLRNDVVGSDAGREKITDIVVHSVEKDQYIDVA